MPAQKQWRHKTRRPDELWPGEATNVFGIGGGYSKLIPVEDDFSRRIIARDVRADETVLCLSDIFGMGWENARKEGHITGNEPMPKLDSDNGAGFSPKLLAESLSPHGIKPIFGTPYRPQGRGKMERFNRRIKEKLCLVLYGSPAELKKVVEETIAPYNRTPHESLDNVYPNDVDAGRGETILQRRKEKKRLTLERRKQSNLSPNNQTPDRHQIATSA